MNKKVNLVSSIIMYVIAGLVLLFYFGIGFIAQMTEVSRLVLLGASSLFLYIGGVLLSKYLDNNKPMKINLYIFFGLYLILLITLTLFDSLWLRNGFNFSGFDNIQDRINLVPFKTIMTFVKEFDSMYSTSQIMLNLFGNVCAFMPMALFLPLLFKRQNKAFQFVITLTLMILGIEFLQLITGSGRFDIDDLILNLFGAVLVYLLFKIKSVNALIHNIFLLEKNKISKKSYIKIILFIVIAIVLFMGVIAYRNKLYDKNYEEYSKIYNPEIMFEHIDECSDNNLFYEDEVYKYYFECYGNDDFYLIVNNEEKYHVKDFLDNSKYNYDIDMLLSTMDYNNIKYKVENKYPHFNMKVKNTFGSAYYGPSDVDSDIAKLVLKDKSVDVNNLEFEVNIIPKKSGEEVMNVDFEIYEDGETKTITKKVKVTVDEDLNVTYKEE